MTNSVDCYLGFILIGYQLKGKLQMPELWTVEQPNLYTLVITFKDASGHIFDCESCQQISITPKQLLVNGQPAMIRGVNRHEHRLRNLCSINVSSTKAWLEKMITLFIRKGS